MPELPEAERARTAIERRALGRRILAVDDRDTYVSRPHGPGEIEQALVGHKLVSAHRRGKTMWIETDDGPTLGLHLGMSGSIVIDGEPAPNNWDRFALEFEDGGRLALRDPRRLGRAVLEPDLSRLGPDAAEISRAEFRARIGGSHAPLKARLMDQSVIAGVGNLLADEILWQARLDPRRRPTRSSWTSSTACAGRSAPRCGRRSAAAAPTPATSCPPASPRHLPALRRGGRTRHGRWADDILVPGRADLGDC